jgi:NADP-dependent 3-hydroxy acid dehydrogenase YdfG
MRIKQLDDKVIVLTGGTEGIGYECAKAYVTEGAKLVILALGEDRLAYVMAELGTDHLGICCDIRSDIQVKQAIEKTLAHFGKIDAIHNNAGIATPQKHWTIQLKMNGMT